MPGRMTRTTTGLTRGCRTGLAIGFFGNLGIAALTWMVAVLGGDGDLAGAGLMVVLFVGTPVSVVFGGIIGAGVGVVLELLNAGRRAEVVYVLIAAAAPLLVAAVWGTLHWSWLAMGGGGALVFALVGSWQGERHAAEAQGRDASGVSFDPQRRLQRLRFLPRRAA